MSNKNSNLETKNNVVANPTMTKEQMEKFVKDNYSIVPRFQCGKFNALENKVKDLFVRRKATTEDVLRVIEFCKKFIEASKVEEMNKLQAEIDRLSELKRTLENS